MTEKELTVTNELGLHVRPAVLIVQKCGSFKSEIWLIKGDKRVSARSIMNLLSLQAPRGTHLKIMAEGDDEREAVEAIYKLFEENFGED
ncbi:MAG: phosphocarrier protein HPr [candidate division Zixibacteria bacterium 4484_93]|nr:MAG: phosphocarrier protein HPr [candidate division Zixibacteria bacterium 4484_93]RKZ34904.1 MAG: phosphocarrier protein HPr [bacterium]